MTRLGLNEAKTSVRDARRERFDFLGYTFGPHRYRKDGHWYLGASQSKKSVLRLKAKVGDLLVPGNMGAWPLRGRLRRLDPCGTGSTALRSMVRDRLNRLLGGWAAYFDYGTRLIAYRRSTITSATGSATSWSGVTRCRRAAPGATPMGWCSAISARFGYAGSILAPRRVPRDEASWKAGCGKSARPV